MAPIEKDESRWFVMRDLKRPNAREFAWQMLRRLGFRVFTPLKIRVVENGGRRERREVPFVQDLLFVYSSRADLDRVVDHTDTLQYRYQKGKGYRTPMEVPAADMERFIAAVDSAPRPQYLHISEITPSMLGTRIRMICGGALDGYEGKLLKIKGSGKKRIVVELPGLLAAAIEVGEADYIEIV